MFGSKGVAASMLSLYRAYRMAMLVYERYRAKVRKDEPYRIMMRARMDTVFPVIDKGVKWGTEVADMVDASPVEIWVPFASDGNLEGGISDKVRACVRRAKQEVKEEFQLFVRTYGSIRVGHQYPHRSSFDPCRCLWAGRRRSPTSSGTSPST